MAVWIRWVAQTGKVGKMGVSCRFFLLFFPSFFFLSFPGATNQPQTGRVKTGGRHSAAAAFAFEKGFATAINKTVLAYHVYVRTGQGKTSIGSSSGGQVIGLDKDRGSQTAGGNDTAGGLESVVCVIDATRCMLLIGA